MSSSGESLRGRLVLDSSVLVAMLDGSGIGAKVTEAVLAGEVTAYASRVSLTEAEYVLCRKVGGARARSAVDDLLASNYLSIEDGPSVHRGAAAIKCDRAISLADCYTLAVAAEASCRPVFLFKEQELLSAMEKKPFAVDPLFLT